MLQLKLVILPLDASDELLSMLRQEREKRKANARAPAPTFGIAFMTLAEVRWVRVKVVNRLWEGTEEVSSRHYQAEIYHPLVLASMACEMKLRTWHGSRSHRQQVRRLRGHEDGCSNRPNGPGGFCLSSVCFLQ